MAACLVAGLGRQADGRWRSQKLFSSRAFAALPGSTASGLPHLLLRARRWLVGVPPRLSLTPTCLKASLNLFPCFACPAAPCPGSSSRWAATSAATLGPGTRATRGSACGGECISERMAWCTTGCQSWFDGWCSFACCCMPVAVTVSFAAARLLARISPSAHCRRYHLPPTCCLPPGVDDFLVHCFCL